jgi:hypothetical protein
MGCSGKSNPWFAKKRKHPMKYTLFDHFNMRTISRHRSFETASRAQVRHSRALKRTHGRNSYLPTVIMLNGQITLK